MWKAVNFIDKNTTEDVVGGARGGGATFTYIRQRQDIRGNPDIGIALRIWRNNLASDFREDVESELWYKEDENE